MADTTPPLSVQIFNDGACIRIEKDGKILLVSKEQVKTIDIVHDNIVRIDIGEGALRNIFLNHQNVSQPVVASASDLRDVIKEMMISDNYDGEDAREETQISVLNKLVSIVQLLQTIKEQDDDFSKSDPTLIDESNPNTIYKGWHRDYGDTTSTEWAILRIRKSDDLIIYEWVDGAKAKFHKWDDRITLSYRPIQYGPSF